LAFSCENEYSKKHKVLEQMDLLKELPNQLIVVMHGEMTENKKKLSSIVVSGAINVKVL
jgi:hypothetical protein